MADELEPWGEEEILIVPVDPEDGLALVAGVDTRLLGTVEPTPRSLIDRFAEVAGYAGGGTAARRLADGSLVRLAPETMQKLNEGAKFARSGGRALGVLKDASGRKFAGPVRFLPGVGQAIAPLPEPLDRRVVEPRVVRDNATDAAKQTGRAIGRGSVVAGRSVRRGAARAARAARGQAPVRRREG